MVGRNGRIGAVVATALIVATTAHVFVHHRRRPGLVLPSVLLIMLLAAQITLGALTVLTGKQYIINSLHVVTGAFVLVTSLVLTLRACRARFADAGVQPSRVEAAGRQIASGPAGARA